MKSEKHFQAFYLFSDYLSRVVARTSDCATSDQVQPRPGRAQPTQLFILRRGLVEK